MTIWKKQPFVGAVQSTTVVGIKQNLDCKVGFLVPLAIRE